MAGTSFPPRCICSPTSCLAVAGVDSAKNDSNSPAATLPAAQPHLKEKLFSEGIVERMRYGGQKSQQGTLCHDYSMLVTIPGVPKVCGI